MQSDALKPYVMKSISIMEAQQNLAKWVREVESGAELAITRHKVVIARLAPPKQEEDVPFRTSRR